jgi:hypothetical protein
MSRLQAGLLDFPGEQLGLPPEEPGAEIPYLFQRDDVPAQSKHRTFIVFRLVATDEGPDVAEFIQVGHEVRHRSSIREPSIHEGPLAGAFGIASDTRWQALLASPIWRQPS